MKYRLALNIGRYQPFHRGHEKIVREGLKIAQQVMLLIGSCYEPRSLRNPWTIDERIKMIRTCFTPEENSRLILEPLLDIRYSDTLWLTQVQKAVFDHGVLNAEDTVLIGAPHPVKSGAYYTSFFPQWDSVAVNLLPIRPGTQLREHLLDNQALAHLQSDMSEGVLSQIAAFLASSEGQDLMDEFTFIKNYKKGWENAPFPPTHVTVDAVVVQSGHILLVKRGARPGKGLLALPGGFIKQEETLLNAMVRELKEETQIKIPIPALIGSIKQQMVFDDPYRSDRGRTITHAFYLELRGEESLPKIKGAKDASQCLWLPLGQLDSINMFEDHYFIIQKMLGTL